MKAAKLILSAKADAGLAARTIRRSVAVRRFFMADCKGVQLLDSL